jgi:mannose-6-phosphate isomerase-like protein (cupin superfamily)
MSEQPRYSINLFTKYRSLELIDVPTVVAACTEKWFNQTLTEVNDSVVRVGVVEGEFHWHKHEEDDEFFFVLEGQLLIDLEDRTIQLGPHQGVTVPKGTMHRPRAPRRTVMLMVETRDIAPLGDTARPDEPRNVRGT